MDGLPSNIIFNIFSTVPAKCLARSRCVSKLWCKYIDDRYLAIIHDQRVKQEPTPILCHSHRTRDGSARSLCLHIIESKQTETGATDHTCKLKLEPKEDPFLEFLRKKPLSKSYEVRIEFRGSCNGLMCLSQDEDCVEGSVVTSLVVVNPLKKECYELPTLPLRFDSFMDRESCGLGFDTSTSTLKMVCVLFKQYVHWSNPDLVRENLCTLVHVFGTNSWKEIPQVPFYPIEGKSVFANGCLYWLASSVDIKTDYGAPVIWFDVEKEEFGLIGPPNGKCDLGRIMGCGYDYLVDLNGEVAFVFLRTMEVWVLKQKEWVPHCRIEKRLEPGYYTEILGCWNRDGDMLIRDSGNGYHEFFVYNLKSGTLHKTSIVGEDDGIPPYIFMRPNKLSSIRGIGTNSFPMKKTDLKESCQRLLAEYYYDLDRDSLLSRNYYKFLYY